MRAASIFVLTGVIAAAAAAGAQDAGSAPEANWAQMCQQLKAEPLHKPAPTGPLPAAALHTCDAIDFYYGISAPANYPAALECGWYQLDHPDPHSGDMFRGAGVLTMLYANGLGVPRNYPLAERMSCEMDFAADAEYANRLGHLEALSTERHPDSFDLCDDITSGLSMGFCTSIETRRADATRDRAIAALAAKLPPAAQQRLPGLEAAERAFEDARANGEVDLSGTARGMFALEEQKRLRDQFLINLQRFAAGDVPATTAQGVAELDKQLNAVYQQLLTAPASTWQYGTIRPAGIRETERAWVALSQAWEQFAGAAYPSLAPERIRAQLIRLRLHQLRSLLPRGG